MRVLVAAVAGALIELAVPSATLAETWPSRPVKVVVPFGPDAATDAVARVLASDLSQSLGQLFVVVNKGGADDAIGGTEAARRTATILGPAGLPADIVEKVNKATVAAFAKPEIRETLSKQGFAAQTGTAAELGAFLKDQVQAWGTSLREAGLEPQ